MTLSCFSDLNRAKTDSEAQNAVILPSWKVSPAAEEVRRPFSFKLSHEGMPDYYFAAENSSDFDTWMAVSHLGCFLTSLPLFLLLLLLLLFGQLHNMHRTSYEEQ